MIQFDKDGVTLVGYDANGNRFAHNYLEGSLYDDMLTVRKAQIAAASENVQNAANYTNVITQINQNEAAGRPHDAPPIKPQQKVIDDLGQGHVRAVRAPAAGLRAAQWRTRKERARSKWTCRTSRRSCTT